MLTFVVNFEYFTIPVIKQKGRSPLNFLVYNITRRFTYTLSFFKASKHIYPGIMNCFIIGSRCFSPSGITFITEVTTLWSCITFWTITAPARVISFRPIMSRIRTHQIRHTSQFSSLVINQGVHLNQWIPSSLHLPFIPPFNLEGVNPDKRVLIY